MADLNKYQVDFLKIVAERDSYRETLEYLSVRPYDEGYREVARSALEHGQEINPRNGGNDG